MVRQVVFLDCMRRAIFCSLFLLIAAPSSWNVIAQDVSSIPADRVLQIMSSNVRYGTAKDGPDAWESRRDRLRQCWAEQQADLIGTQEMLPFQADFLQQAFPEYVYVGRSRELENEQGEQCGIFYRRTRFVELERGHFWLSETPDTPGSRGWDADLPRMATWVKLFDRKVKQPFMMVNTHFDHQGPNARLHSAELLHQKLQPWLATYRLIVTGDFNCGEQSPPYIALTASFPSAEPLRDTFRVAYPDMTGDEGSFNAFQGRRSGPRIDWILATDSWHIEGATIVRTEYEGRYPSDHFPVTARVRW